MRTLSRHLPNPPTVDGKIPLLGKLVLTSTFAALGYSLFVQPYPTTITLGAIVVFFTSLSIIENRRISRLRCERADTICEFRRSFDLRKVDPWIVRATHEAFGSWFDAKQPKFPLRASDSIEDDLKIDWEDVDDLAHAVAQRAGYDISDCETNPLYGRVKTVKDFVLFFTHQPRTREAGTQPLGTKAHNGD